MADIHKNVIAQSLVPAPDEIKLFLTDVDGTLTVAEGYSTLNNNDARLVEISY